MDVENGEVTVRYNLSVNDGGSFIQISRRTGVTNHVHANIYNNTFYTTSGDFKQLINVTGDFADDINYGSLKNNIFCYAGSAEKYPFGVERFSNWQFAGDFEFANNCWYGWSGYLSGLLMLSLPTNENGQMKSDPLFNSAGLSEAGRSNVSGYRLGSNSPCLDKGLRVENNGGLDFWGNAFKEVKNIGAYNGAGIKK